MFFRATFAEISLCHDATSEKPKVTIPKTLRHASQEVIATLAEYEEMKLLIPTMPFFGMMLRRGSLELLLVPVKAFNVGRSEVSNGQTPCEGFQVCPDLEHLTNGFERDLGDAC